jgi:hypothetical protein
LTIDGANGLLHLFIGHLAMGKVDDGNDHVLSPSVVKGCVIGMPCLPLPGLVSGFGTYGDINHGVCHPSSHGMKPHPLRP